VKAPVYGQDHPAVLRAEGLRVAVTGTGRGSSVLSVDVDSLRLVADSIPHIVWIATSTGSTEYFNEKGVSYSGRSPESSYGRGKWVGLVHPDDAEEAQAAWAEAVRTQTPYTIDFRLRRADGQYRWHRFRVCPIGGPGHSAQRWIGTATDVEDTKRAAADLRIAHRTTAEVLTLLETFLSEAPVGFAFVDRELRISRLNETMAAVNGSTVAELLVS
jgi:two-component system NtrC family sensor kinase